jgi:hypothetical protein
MTLDIDTLYKDLLKSYSSSIKRQDYEKDANKVAEVLQKNPSLVNEQSSLLMNKSKGNFVPYPDYDDGAFNRKIFDKKEFNRAYHDVGSTSYKNADFDDLSKARCSQIDFKLTANQKFVKNFLSHLTHYN